MELSKSLFSGRWGLEREVLRVDTQGTLATTPHPFSPDHPSITVDFGESQTELITGVHDSPGEALDELAELQSQLETGVGTELLWPFSLPGAWTEGQTVEPARFGGHPAWDEQRRYRQTLVDHHGGARQILSGVHVNYSFGPDHPGGDYWALARNYLRFQPILTYLLAASPWLTPPYRTDLTRRRTAGAARAAQRCAPKTVSVRQGALGYGLPGEIEEAVDVRFDSLEEYLEKLQQALKPREGRPALLEHEREFYASVRPKGASREKGRSLEALTQKGVSYLEFRTFDLDPLAPLGIRRETLLFLELFVMAATVLPSPLMKPAERRSLRSLELRLAQCSLRRGRGAPRSVRVLWTRMAPVLKALSRLGTPEHRAAYQQFEAEILGRSPRTVDRVVSQFADRSPVVWGLARARLHRAWSSLELSTRLLIEEADRRGVAVTLLDAPDNFLLLEHHGRQEYVKQATRTSADPYIAALIMESKIVTKAVLRRGGFRVPEGREFHRADEAMRAWPEFRGRTVVVKPNATNFGDGVTLLDADATEAQWLAAMDTAFSLDRQVLVEEFAVGLEFRFLVIDGKTRAVLHRVPANVTGDGVQTIRELVAAKNRHPWRGEGYRKPLEKIRIEEVEIAHLAHQGLNPESVPAAGQRVFLRKNSNISTGGDSLDFTDTMPAVYSRIAERAAQAVGARICGLDLILPDWTNAAEDAPYTILELNFNPALHIHTFPAEGQNRRPEAAVLDLLGFGGSRRIHRKNLSPISFRYQAPSNLTCAAP